MIFNIPNLITAIDCATSRFNDDMLDMNGDWHYQDRGAIEKDLGMSIEDYESLVELKSSLEILEANTYKSWDNFSAKEAALILKYLK